MVLTRTEAVGKPETRTTTYTYTVADWPSFVTSITEPSVAKPPENKITTYQWNSGLPKESVLTTSVSGFLQSTDAMPTIYTTTTTFDGSSTPATGRPHRMIEVSGPATNQKTTFGYFSDTDPTVNRRGRLQTTALYTSATAHLDTQFDDYDVFGTARSVTDPNGVETTKATDDKGRVTSVTSKMPPGDPSEPPDYITSYTYDTRDRLTDVTLPAGNKLHYDYQDGSNWLTDTIRVDLSGNQQERLHLTLNLIGGKTQEDAQVCSTPAVSCATWVTRRTESFTYNADNRLASIVHPDSTQVIYAYDSRGNLKSVRDERHAAANTLYEYDFLDRLKKVTQKQTIVPGPDIVTMYAYPPCQYG